MRGIQSGSLSLDAFLARVRGQLGELVHQGRSSGRIAVSP
jgi:hypothetical protein